MYAIHLTSKRKYKVLSYKNLIYYETDNESLPYYILELSNIIEQDIPIGYEYTYYYIEGNLYTGFLTNALECHAEQQMNIWELI